MKMSALPVTDLERGADLAAARSRRQAGARRFNVALLSLSLTLAASVVLATGIGRMDIGWGNIMAVILGKLGLSESTVKGFCDTTVSLLVLPLEQYIGGLALDSNLSLTGKCMMEDNNDDLKVDKLTDGVWTGTINVQGAAGKAFKGDFAATRQPGF